MSYLACRKKRLSHRTKPIQIGKSSETGEPVFLNYDDRKGHVHIAGLTGFGKTNFIEHMIRQDIEANHGVMLIDPDGPIYQNLVRWCTTRGFFGSKKIILLDPSSDDRVFGFNPLNFGNENPRNMSRCVDDVVNASAQVWGGEDSTKTPNIKLYLGSFVYLLASMKLTLDEMDLLMTDNKSPLFNYFVQTVKDRKYKGVFEMVASMSPKEFRSEVLSSFKRMFEFTKHPMIRSIIGQQKNVINFQEVMDEGAIVLVNLSAKVLSPEMGSLLGTLMINDLLQKARMRDEGSRPFFLYIDEAYDFLNKDIMKIIDKTRKHGLHLTVAHHHIGQLDDVGPAVKKAIMGIQTKFIFRPEFDDAGEFAKRMIELDLEEPVKALIKPTVTGQKVIRLRKWQDSEGYSQQEGITEQPGSETMIDGDGQVYDADGELLTSNKNSVRSFTTGGIARNSNETRSRVRSMGEGETLANQYQNLPGGVYSLEAQTYKGAWKLSRLKEGRALCKLRSGQGQFITVPLVKLGYANLNRVAECVEEVKNSLPFINDVKAVEVETTKRQGLLKEASEELCNTDDDPKEVINLE